VKQIKPWGPALIWMGVIYLMSAMPGEVSGEQSGTLVRVILGAVSLVFGEEFASGVPLETIHLLIRKAAHMTEYAILFALYRRALKLSGAKRPGIAALLMSAAYATTDEWHQGFVADRGPSIVDVGIDTLGAAAMWGLISVCGKIKEGIKKER